jgi:hypothetical protein
MPCHAHALGEAKERRSLSLLRTTRFLLMAQYEYANLKLSNVICKFNSLMGLNIKIYTASNSLLIELNILFKIQNLTYFH